MTIEATPGALGSNDQLGPCACCGSAAAFGVATGDDEGAYFVYCTNALCGLTTPLIFACMDDPKPLLRERWNQRPGGAKQFEVHVAGPDDLIRFANELDAHRHANAINKLYLADREKHPESEVLCVATVHAGA